MLPYASPYELYSGPRIYHHFGLIKALNSVNPFTVQEESLNITHSLLQGTDQVKRRRNSAQLLKTFSDPPEVTCSLTNLLPSFILPTQASNSSSRLLDSEIVSLLVDTAIPQN